jgi:hypothetical protein
MAIKKKIFIGELEVDLPNGKTTRYSIYDVDGGMEVVGPNLERDRLHQGIKRIEHVITEMASRHGVGFSSVRQVPKR